MPMIVLRSRWFSKLEEIHLKVLTELMDGLQVITKVSQPPPLPGPLPQLDMTSPLTMAIRR